MKGISGQEASRSHAGLHFPAGNVSGGLNSAGAPASEPDLCGSPRQYRTLYRMVPSASRPTVEGLSHRRLCSPQVDTAGQLRGAPILHPRYLPKVRVGDHFRALRRHHQALICSGTCSFPMNKHIFSDGYVMSAFRNIALS